jgi:hypothetical protein
MTRIRYKFNPFKETGVYVPPSKREEAAEAVAEYVKEQILSNTAEAKTSVQGGKWRKKLTPEYAKNKDGSPIANLENSGAMLDALKTGSTRSGDVFVEVSGDQAGKAEGNLLGTYGASAPIEGGKYAREFMPHKRGQKLSLEIMRGVKEILEDYGEEN